MTMSSSHDHSRSTLVEALAHWAEQTPDRIACTFVPDRGPDQALTYAELDRRARAVAAMLIDHGAVAERALLLFHEWNGHAAVYHLLTRGARLVEGDPSGSLADPLVYALGRTRVHVLWFGPATRELPERLPLEKGDEVWLLGPMDGFPDPDVRAALAPGLVLVSMSAPGSYLEVHAVKEESR